MMAQTVEDKIRLHGLHLESVSLMPERWEWLMDTCLGRVLSLDGHQGREIELLCMNAHFTIDNHLRLTFLLTDHGRFYQPAGITVEDLIQRHGMRLL